MISRLLFTLAFVAASVSIFAQQQAIHLTYEWQENPKIHTISEDLKEFPAVHVLHNRFLELRIQTAAESYLTEHKITHINTSAGIEQFNKVYIPMHGDKKLVSLEVRAIDPSGKITLLKKENLKELNNVEGYGNFKIFAVEGLVVGGEVEYIYTTKANPQTFGRYPIQGEIPVMEANVEIICPDKFQFVAKSYNGLPQPKSGMFDTIRRSLSMTAKDIPALIEEEYSAHEASRMRIDFKLESNGTTAHLLTWEDIAGRFLESSFQPSASSKVRKMLKSLDLENLSTQQKIQAVEKYIKTNFTIKEGDGDEYDDVRNVIEKRVGNERGMLKLYMSCWAELSMSPQLVLCSNRFNGKIDPAFAVPADISDVIFYFPALKQYLVPSVPYLRLGAAPDQVAGGKGIFIDYELLPSMEYSRYLTTKYSRFAIQNIEPLDYTHNNMGVKAVVHFNGKPDRPEITHETFWQGYRAALYRGLYQYAPETKREEFLKQVTLSGIDGLDIQKRELEGQDINLSFDPDTYFKVKTNCTASSLVEQAGEDYLLAVGKLIGRQSELYQEKQRKMDVEFNSIANYNHEITLEIPHGYTCSGLEGIKIRNEVKNGKEDVMKFHSDYELSGNKLTIKVNEVYKVLNLPKEQYEAFRKVVNSAADFNKVVLVLHPEPK